MEDDDLFVDEEDELTELASEKPKVKAKAKPKAKKTSDAAAKSGGPRQAEKRPAKTPVGVALEPSDTQSVSLMAASILVIAAFVVGFIAGGVVLDGQTQQPATEPIAVPGTSSGTGSELPGAGQSAKPLTQQQLQKGLPKGHPKVSPSQGATSTGGGAGKAPSK